MLHAIIPPFMVHLNVPGGYQGIASSMQYRCSSSPPLRCPLGLFCICRRESHHLRASLSVVAAKNQPEQYTTESLIGTSQI